MGVHAQLVRNLAGRLRGGGRYDKVATNYEYCEWSYRGEVDVLAYHEPSNTWHFYEVKCTSSKKTFNKATAQYRRFCRAHPGAKVKGVYFTRTEARRLG